MHTVRSDLMVRLHVDRSGSVWYGDGVDEAVNTYLDPCDFFADEARLEDLDSADTIRLLGTRDNAPLVVRLHDRRASFPDFRGKRVELGSPACVPASWLRDDPISVMHHIRQPPAVSSLSGAWHEMTSYDYPSYAMAAALADVPGREVPEVAIRISQYHPAWPALSFISTLDTHAACRFMCDVIDPRWFRHPTRPGRLTRLFSYLGLTPENMTACVGEGQSGLNFNRATTAVRSWYNLRAQKAGRESGDFLLKSLDVYKGRQAGGLLRGTQRFVSFVCAVWLDAVRPPHPEVGFTASRFFRDHATAKAFDRHVAACKRL